MFKDLHPAMKVVLAIGVLVLLVACGALMQKGLNGSNERKSKRTHAAAAREEARKDTQLANACAAACRPSLCPPKPKKQDHKPMGETFCKRTGKVYFHKRVDKKLPAGAYLEVGVEYHMRSGLNWVYTFTFTCELSWGDNLHNSRTKSTQVMLGGAEGKKASLLFNLPWRGKEKSPIYKYGVNCSCQQTPMYGLQIVESAFTPQE